MTGLVTHGHTRDGTTTREFNSWIAMRQRCNDPKNEKWPRYGGRGIRVCERWQNSFEAFLEDMGERPKDCTLGRLDNDGPYCKDNCEWQTAVEQANNRPNNRIIQHGGRSLTAAEWARELGMRQAALISRLDRGWSIARALDPSARRRAEPTQRPQPAWKTERPVCAHCGVAFARVTSRSRCCSSSCRKALTNSEFYHRNADRINDARREKWSRDGTR